MSFILKKSLYATSEARLNHEHSSQRKEVATLNVQKEATGHEGGFFFIET